MLVEQRLGWSKQHEEILRKYGRMNSDVMDEMNNEVILK